MYTKTVYDNFSSYHYCILYEGGVISSFFCLFFAFMPQIPLFAHFRNIIHVYSEKKEEYELDKYTSMGYNNNCRAGNSLG